MDNNIQRAVEPAVSLFTRFAIISTHSLDKLRLHKFSMAEIRAITEIVQGAWPKRIQYTRSLSSAYEIKLAGKPWDCSDQSSDATQSRVLVRALLAFLFSRGWVLTLPTAITDKIRDGDTLIFRNVPTPPPEMEWLAIMFSLRDHLRLIGAPPDLISGIQVLLRGHSLIQDEKWENRTQNSYDFKLRGYPWFARSEEERVSVKMLTLEILETLERFGWSLYASVEHNSFLEETGEEYPRENCKKKDTWYCVRRRDWVQGRPVIHR